MLFNKHLEKSLRVCATCGHHFRISAPARLDQLLDPGTFRERDAGLVSRDPLGFVDSKPYADRLVAAQTATGRSDAAMWGFGALGGRRIAICALDFAFMGGSMGSVVGEKVTRAAEGALAEGVPARHRQRLGRRPDAGGDAGPHAAGQDDRRARARCAPPACRTSPSLPTRRPAASSPRSPCSATSTSPSRTR